MAITMGSDKTRNEGNGNEEMEMGNRNEEMEMKKWRNGGNKSEAWRMTLSLLWRYGRRCGQGRLHQPGNKMGTCNISSNVAGRD